MQTSKIAILLFTHDSEIEIQNKTFLTKGSKKKNKAIANCLIENSINKISSLDYPYFIVNTKKQIGSSFGEKLSNAIEGIFLKGFEKILVTGSDIPALSKSILNKSLNELNNKDFVLGPTFNGGTYLIGLSAKCFNKNEFEKLGWQTNTLFSEIKNYANSISNSLVITEHLADINNPSDLSSFLKTNTKCVAIASVLAKLIHQSNYLQRNFIQIKSLTSLYYFFGLAAPPLCKA